MSAAEALSRLAAAGRIRSAWLPGMLFTNGDRVLAWEDGELTLAPGYIDSYEWTPGPDDAPADNDPATTGCLLALLREAVGFPYLLPVWNAYLGRRHDPEAEDDDLDNSPESIARDNARQWRIELCGVGDEVYARFDSEVLGEGPTEHAAIVAALVAVAESL